MSLLARRSTDRSRPRLSPRRTGRRQSAPALSAPAADSDQSTSTDTGLQPAPRLHSRTRRVSCRLLFRLPQISRKPGRHLPEGRLTVFWNPDGATLQRVTDPAQESFLCSLHDLSLIHISEPTRLGMIS